MSALHCNSPSGACQQPDWCVNKGACAYQAVALLPMAFQCQAAGGVCINADLCVRQGVCMGRYAPEPVLASA
jgi:hypothetical protein